MRILLASDFYAPFIGGAERQTQLLGRELTSAGHRVDVATVWHRGLAELEPDGNVAVHRLKGLTTAVPWFSKDGARRYHPPLPDPGISLSLRRLVERLEPDLVHACGWIAYSCAAALLGKRTPLLLSVRDYGYSCATRTLLRDGRECDGPGLLRCLSCASQRYGWPKALAAVASVFGGRALLRRKVGAAHSISTYVQMVVHRDLLDAASRGSSRGDTIPDLVIPSFLEPTRPDAGGDEFLDRLPKEPFILFVGALQAHKGLHVLLEAYQRLERRPPLVLIGTPWPDTPREFPPGVTVLHNVPHERVMLAWEHCLFGVAPSLWPEPFGGVLAEAMSKGKALVSTDLGGPVDIVEQGVTGLLVPPGDATRLAQAMALLIEDSELRERLGSAAHERVRRFMAGAVLPRFEQLYQRAVESPAGAPA